MTYDFDDESDDEAVARLRRQAEIRAIEKGLEMLDDPATSSTARASIVRAFIGDATARRNDTDAHGKELHQMTSDELAREIRASARRIAALRAEPINVEFEEIPPVGGVFS